MGIQVLLCPNHKNEVLLLPTVAAVEVASEFLRVVVMPTVVVAVLDAVGDVGVAVEGRMVVCAGNGCKHRRLQLEQQQQQQYL